MPHRVDSEIFRRKTFVFLKKLLNSITLKNSKTKNEAEGEGREINFLKVNEFFNRQ